MTSAAVLERLRLKPVGSIVARQSGKPCSCKVFLEEAEKCVKVDEDTAKVTAPASETASPFKKDGNRHTFPNGDVYEGEGNDEGQMHGRGVYTWQDGTKRHGSRYEGDFKSGSKHGRGKFTWPSGDRFEGEYKDDKPHGAGVFVSATGDKLEGEWRQGVFAGKGKEHIAASRARYEGEFKDGKKWGKGTLTYGNGDRYEGEFANGVRHGKGVYTQASTGSRYEGEFKEDHMDGKGVFHWPQTGVRYEGEFKAGEKSGRGKETHPDGHVLEGDWKAGQLVKDEAAAKKA